MAPLPARLLLVVVIPVSQASTAAAVLLPNTTQQTTTTHPAPTTPAENTAQPQPEANTSAPANTTLAEARTQPPQWPEAITATAVLLPNTTQQTTTTHPAPTAPAESTAQPATTTPAEKTSQPPPQPDARTSGPANATATTTSATTTTTTTTHPWLAQNAVCHEFDEDMCKGIALGAHPELANGPECGDSCERWVALRGAVWNTAYLKMADLVLDFVDVPLLVVSVLSDALSAWRNNPDMIIALPCTWIATTLAADVALPIARFALLSSVAGDAQAFAGAKCFTLGEANQDIIYVKDAIQGSFMEGWGVMQIIAGIMSGALACTALCVEDNSVGPLQIFSAVSSLVAFGADFTDYWLNTKVLLDKTRNIEGAVLAGGTFGDQSHSVFYMKGAAQADEHQSLWVVVGITFGAVFGCFFCACFWCWGTTPHCYRD